MIPKTISTDEVIYFKSYLMQQSFNFNQNFNSHEVLAQVLSAWEEFRKNQFLKPDKDNADFLICEKCGARWSRKDY